MLEKLLGARYECLKIVGGGTKDGFLMELTSSALNRKVSAGPVEATAAGNIMVQAIAAGVVKNLTEGREIIRNSFELKDFAPQSDLAALYDANVEKFSAITGK